MKTYTTEEARKQLGDIITDAAAGISSIITYHGIPSALVIPMNSSRHFATDADSATANETHGR